MTHQREAPAANGLGSRLRLRMQRPRFGAPRQPPASAAVANAVNAAPPENKVDVAAAAASAAVNAAPPENKVDVAAAAATAAVDAAPPENKVDVAAAAATAAVNAAPTKDQADAATAMIHALPRSARQQTIGRLVPDQQATNKIWLWIVITFAIVLGVSIVALISVILSAPGAKSTRRMYRSC